MASTSIEIYYKYVCTFEESIQYLIEKTQKDFVVFLNIPYEAVTNSLNYHMESNPKFKDWVKNWSFFIKEILESKLQLYPSPVGCKMILDLITYQIQNLMGES